MDDYGYKLSHGGPSGSESRFFPTHKLNDALVRFSEKVLEYDRDAGVHAAWVSLTKVVSGSDDNFLGWTKTSDESPTIEGELIE